MRRSNFDRNTCSHRSKTIKLNELFHRNVFYSSFIFNQKRDRQTQIYSIGNLLIYQHAQNIKTSRRKFLNPEGILINVRIFDDF